VYNVGVLNNLTANYLTDSLNFRIYTGTFDDENGYIYYQCAGNSISIEKREQTNQVFRVDNSIVNGKLVTTPDLKYDLKTTNKITYSLKDLKKQHKFE